MNDDDKEKSSCRKPARIYIVKGDKRQNINEFLTLFFIYWLKQQFDSNFN